MQTQRFVWSKNSWYCKVLCAWWLFPVQRFWCVAVRLGSFATPVYINNICCSSYWFQWLLKQEHLEADTSVDVLNHKGIYSILFFQVLAYEVLCHSRPTCLGTQKSKTGVTLEFHLHLIHHRKRAFLFSFLLLLFCCIKKKMQGHLNKVTQIISRSTENDSSIKQMYVENFHRAALAAAKPNLFSIHQLAA